MEFKVEIINDLILVVTEGTDTKEARQKLQDYLREKDIEVLKMYYLEVFSGGKVSGAMAYAQVQEEPERNKKFRSKDYGTERFVTFEVPYKEYYEDSINDNNIGKELNAYLKDQSYRMKDFPFFELFDKSGEEYAKFYLMIK